MPSRICSILDCGRVHYAKGLCERHYRARLRKSRLSYVSGHDSAGNGPNKEVKCAEFPGSAGGRAGDDRPLTSPAPLLSRGGGGSSHLLANVLGLSGTGPATTPSAAFGGFRWR